MLPALLACTDYELSKGSDAFAGPREADTAVVEVPDTGDSGDPPDTDPPPDTAPPEDPPPDTDTPAEDPCYEPEDGYGLNPAARLVVYDASQAITVTFSYSDTSYSDVLWVESPGYSQLFEAWTTSAGTSYTLGPYAVGTEVIFGLRVARPLAERPRLPQRRRRGSRRGDVRRGVPLGVRLRGPARRRRPGLQRRHDRGGGAVPARRVGAWTSRRGAGGREPPAALARFRTPPAGRFAPLPYGSSTGNISSRTTLVGSSHFFAASWSSAGVRLSLRAA